MIVFWLVLLGLALVACGLFCWPERLNHDHLNTTQAITDFKRFERGLQAKLKSNELEESGYHQKLVEQKRALLWVLEQSNASGLVAHGTKLYLLNAVFLISFSLIFYISQGQYRQLDLQQQARIQLPALAARSISAESALSAEELQQLMLGLRSRIAEQGEDPVAWRLLGISALQLQDAKTAVEALKRAVLLDSDNPSLLFNYVQALILQNQAQHFKLINALLDKILSVRPNFSDARLFKATLAMEQQDYPVALTLFEELLSQLPESDQRYQLVFNQIDKIKQISAGQPRALAIKINVDRNLSLEGFSQLFLFAKAVDPNSGQVRIDTPLAVKKISDFSFPLETQLSDNDLMLEGQLLSQHSFIRVYARLSKDNDVQLISGELEGLSPIVSLTDKTANNGQISITLSKKIP